MSWSVPSGHTQFSAFLNVLSFLPSSHSSCHMLSSFNPVVFCQYYQSDKSYPVACQIYLFITDFCKISEVWGVKEKTANDLSEGWIIKLNRVL